MKRNIKYSLILLAVLAQVSCNNWLELEPPSGLTREEFWQTKEDVEAMLSGAYSIMAKMDNLFFLYGKSGPIW